jgi:isocitrate dehydrogenase
MAFIPKNKDSKPTDFEVYQFKGPGVLMGMYNTEESIIEFAHACFKFAL